MGNSIADRVRGASPASSLDIVIVNWNAGPQIATCVRSIAAVKKDNFDLQRVVIVDNASTDGSADELENFGPHPIVLRNKENRGFAGGCNQGAEGSKADYLLFLNPDTELYPNTIETCIAFLDKEDHRQVGIVGVQLIGDSGDIARTCSRLPTSRIFLSSMVGLNRLLPATFPDLFYSEWDHGMTRQVEQVMGAFFFVRRSLFEMLQGFDERFFVYFEEVDFTCRAAQKGFTTVFLGDAKVFHKGCGTTEQIKATRLFYSLRSRLLYAQKHFGRASAWTLIGATTVIEPVSRVVLQIARRSGSGVRDTFVAFSKLWGALPAIMRSRSQSGES
jgi:N-acetylglucosaminyl-diphospho-decaprenol L-rhamnosyltransferase